MLKDFVRIEDVLKSVELEHQTSLFALVAEGNRIKEDYVIFLTGKLLWHPIDTRTAVKSGDWLDILDFPFIVGGGINSLFKPLGEKRPVVLAEKDHHFIRRNT